MIPYGHQDINQTDIDAVVEVLCSDFLTQGPAVPAFEKTIAENVGAKHAVAVNSATSALHIACLALELGKGDRLWTVPNTFVASANCGRYCGSEVDFVDIDPASLNISIHRLQEKLIRAKKEDRLPKVLVPVHFAGQPVEQEKIWELAQIYGFKVLEDASHAIGASRDGEPVGSCRWADITVFSFHPVKIITTGEGGMALTNNDGLAERMRCLRSHGIVRDEVVQTREGPWYYEQMALGFNYRMTDMQAALGNSQMARLAGYVAARRSIADCYDALLADLPLTLPLRAPKADSAWHLYVIQLDDAQRRRAVFEHLRAAGIGVNVHYIPVYLQPDYQGMGFAPGYCPLAENYYARAITLPLYPALSKADQDGVVAALREALA
jgi:UDP-4-amino-4,6-dideoxy-N-acetyl-beta-L-altrosamine transaminase